ncbi:superoxide dismutase [Ni], partial [Lentzea sp. NPDC006480]|uniref:superoxide dismutase [Ni] n=1 Tax=Lentzea sp. NPDC006480 TaxID=3157176 RepID=UPI0033AD3FCD
MRLVSRILRPRVVATAHCDLPCGVYDPAQARIEAESDKPGDHRVGEQLATLAERRPGLGLDAVLGVESTQL